MTSKYDKAFIETFSLPQIDETIEYGKHPSWDSIGHMSLVSSLENEFGISIETDDIIGFSSYQKGKEILKKYGISL